MSDTPRTDDEVETLYDGHTYYGNMVQAVPAEFARRLERENAELRRALRFLLEGLECKNIDKLLERTSSPELFKAIGEQCADQCKIASMFLPDR